MQFDDHTREFLAGRRFGSLATIRADGSPHQTVMWYELDGDHVIMNTLKGRAKEKHLQRDGRASLIVEEGLKYVTLTGTVSIDEDPERGQRTIAQLAERYDGAAEAARQVKENFSHQHRVTLVFRPERIDAHGLDD